MTLLHYFWNAPSVFKVEPSTFTQSGSSCRRSNNHSHLEQLFFQDWSNEEEGSRNGGKSLGTFQSQQQGQPNQGPPQRRWI